MEQKGEITKRARAVIEDVLLDKLEDGIFMDFASRPEKESMRVILSRIRSTLPETSFRYIVIESGMKGDKDYPYWIRIYYNADAKGMRIFKMKSNGEADEVDYSALKTKQPKLKATMETIENESDDDFARRLSGGKENYVQRTIRQMSEDKQDFEYMKKQIGDDFNTPEAQEFIKIFYPKAQAQAQVPAKIDFSQWPPTAVDLITKARIAEISKEDFQAQRPQFASGKKYSDLCDFIYSDEFDINTAKTYVADSTSLK